MSGPHGNTGLSLADKLKKHTPDAAFVNKVARITEPERTDPVTKNQLQEIPTNAAPLGNESLVPLVAVVGTKERGNNHGFKEFKTSYYTTYEIEDDIENLIQKLRRESRERGDKKRFSKKTIIHEGLIEVFKKYGIPESNIIEYLAGGNNG